MVNIDTFLTALKKVYKDKKISFIPRWTIVKDSKFPAYTIFTLEVNELTGTEVTQKFTVQCTENLSEVVYSIKELTEDKIKEKVVGQMIEIMLKYYMYGDAVQ